MTGGECTLLPSRPRIVIERSMAGHIVTMDPNLVLRARLAIRRRRRAEQRQQQAAA